MRTTFLVCLLALLAAGCGLEGPVPQDSKETPNPASSPAPKAAPAPAATTPVAASAKQGGEFKSTVDVSTLGDPPAWTPYAPGIDATEVSLKIPPSAAGNSDRLILYLPHGQHRRHSLGCVFIAPAGVPMFAGNSQADGDRVEHVPYVKAGYAVAALDIDGKFDDSDKSLANMQATYAKFKAAAGGVINGKNALEYVLAKLPEVDPDRLYAAGHSSAATWALLFAEYEPRIKGCIAYAPLSDLFGRAPSGRSAAESHFPGIAKFSPQESIERLRCPVFVFQAEDDRVIPIDINRRFVEALKRSNSEVTFHTVTAGDHYQSMIAEGIPQGIHWLKSLPAESQAKPTLPVVE